MRFTSHQSITPHIRTLLAFLTLLFSNLAQCAEWNGGEKWDLFDCPDRRAMWVWNPAAISGTKNDNRSWDPTPSAPRNAEARFYENYKGSQDLFFDFCENKSIRVLYFFNAVWEWNMADLDNATPRVPNEAGFATFVAEANSRGIQVWLMCYLWDDPNDSRMTITANKQSIKLLAEAVHNFNLAHPTTPVAGIHLDQEPGDTTVYDDLLDTMKIGQDWVDAHSPNIMISQALRPKWRNQNITWNGSTKPMNEHVMATIGHGAYMSYNDEVSIAKSWLTPIVNYATANNKKISSGFEVWDYAGLWPNSDEETWWEEIRNEPLATRFKVDAAAPVTFEDAMHDIVSSYETQSGYDRQVVHSYSNYFEHWFGELPRDYILNLPNGEYVSATQNPAKVNLYQDTRELVGLSQFVGEPTADAGADQTITDSDSLAGESVSLDASASSDSDSSIASYEWKNNNSVIAASENPTVNLAEGVHTITLTVTDNDGRTGIDTVIITVNENSYPLTVSNGSGDGTILEGLTAYIIAETAPAGQHFENWTTSDGGSFGDSNTATTTYTMPSNTAEVTANYRLNDSDGNNLNDAWETAHFERVGTVANDADDDGDGYTTFEEMVFGLDPKVRDPANAAVAIQIVDDAGTNKVEFKFRRPLNFGTLDVTYQLESSSNLGGNSWTLDATAGALSDDAITQWVTFLLPLGPEKAFYRCKVTPTPIQ